MNYNITIDGEISPWGYSKSWLSCALAPFKDEHVDMKISSLGGSVDDALDMRQQLIDHGDVTIYLSGFVASAATIVAMGAKKIKMSKYAMFLVHKCSNFIDVYGRYNADEIDALIMDLEKNKCDNDKIDAVIASLYASKCKKKVEDIMDVLTTGSWLTAQEAYDLGFIDEIVECEGDKINFTPELEYKFNAIGLPTEGLKHESRGGSKPTILAQMFEMLKSLVASRSQETHASDTDDKSTEEAISTYTVAPSAVCSVLSVENLAAASDETVTLTVEQLSTINDSLSSLQDEIASKEDKIAQLNSRIEIINQLPGDTTTTVKSDGMKGVMSTAEMYYLSEKFLN